MKEIIVNDTAAAKAQAKEERRKEQERLAAWAEKHWLEVSYAFTSRHHDQAPRPDEA